MSPIKRSFCWRCLLFALAPLAVLGALGWMVLAHLDSDRANAALDGSGQAERLSELETANAELRAELDHAREDLRVARAAALEANAPGSRDLPSRLEALPAPERAALLAQFAPAPDPDSVAARVAAMTPTQRARYFDALSEHEAFSGWFDGQASDARRTWLRRLPSGAALLDEARAEGEAGSAEQLGLLREQLDAAKATRAEAISARDALAAEQRAAQAQAPSAPALAARLQDMTRSERTDFFVAMTRGAGFAEWLERASPEQRAGFEGVTLSNEGLVDGAEIRRRLAAARGADRERQTLAAELRAARAPAPEALSARLESMAPAERAEFFGALIRDAEFAAWFERSAIERRDAFAADAPAPMKQAIDGVALPYFRAAQTELRRLGLYSGPIDGDWGPASRQSLQAFQTGAGLQPADGLMKPRVLRALRAAEPAEGAAETPAPAPAPAMAAAPGEPSRGEPSGGGDDLRAALGIDQPDSDGTDYVGDLLDGLPHGRGQMTWANGNRYVGDFVNGQRTGEGRIAFGNGVVYEGHFVDGRLTGEGRMQFADGRIYEGDLVDGKAHGQGEYRARNGEVFYGAWRYGCHRILNSGSTNWAWVGATREDCRP